MAAIASLVLFIALEMGVGGWWVIVGGWWAVGSGLALEMMVGGWWAVGSRLALEFSSK